MDYENTNAMKALRGPMSKRATSAEFNEWNARDVCEYIDALRAQLATARADALRAAAAVCDADKVRREKQRDEEQRSIQRERFRVGAMQAGLLSDAILALIDKDTDA